MLMILLSISLKAQQDEYSTDTTMIDTTVISNYPETDEDDYEEEESVSSYFNPNTEVVDVSILEK